MLSDNGRETLSSSKVLLVSGFSGTSLVYMIWYDMRCGGRGQGWRRGG